MTDTLGNFFDFDRFDLERAKISSFTWAFEANDPSVSWLRIIVLLPLVLLQGRLPYFVFLHAISQLDGERGTLRPISY